MVHHIQHRVPFNVLVRIPSVSQAHTAGALWRGNASDPVAGDGLHGHLVPISQMPASSYARKKMGRFVVAFWIGYVDCRRVVDRHEVGDTVALKDEL